VQATRFFRPDEGEQDEEETSQCGRFGTAPRADLLLTAPVDGCGPRSFGWLSSLRGLAVEGPPSGANNAALPAPQRVHDSMPSFVIWRWNPLKRLPS
jgi:hypothetical protein